AGGQSQRLYAGVMFEEAFARDLMKGPQGVAVPAMTWLVTGQWPVPELSFDVSYPRADYSGLLAF
ncbi:hypothetical protein ACX9NI_22860, partial [Mycobacterium sp. ML5]